jgi:hypothetical protein
MKLHRKVARTIPTKRKLKSIEGQTYFNFKDSVRAYTEDHAEQLLPLDTSGTVYCGLPSTTNVV